MRKRTWRIIMLAILLGTGYFLLFYKSYSVLQVASSADCVVSLDIKRIRNTVIWNTLTTPSQWKKVSLSGSKEISWRDMFRIPDYLFIYHCKGQPANVWYTVLTIKDDSDFRKGIKRFGFSERTHKTFNEYFADQSSLGMIRYGDKVLLGLCKVEDSSFLRTAGNELFLQKRYATKEFLEHNTSAGSHFAVQILAEGLSKQSAIVKGNFDKQKITIETVIEPAKQFSFSDTIFQYHASSLLTAGFHHSVLNVFHAFDTSAKQKLSKAAGFNIDSVLLNNSHSTIEVIGITNRVDSAVSYSYDDNFNPVEHVVVNNIREPAFSWRIFGKETIPAYQYWLNNGNLEKTAEGELFLPFPFARSYCTISPGQLSVSTINNGPPPDAQLNAVLFCDLAVEKFPSFLLSFIPGLSKYFDNISSARLLAKKQEGKIAVTCTFLKKQNDLPIVKW